MVLSAKAEEKYGAVVNILDVVPCIVSMLNARNDESVKLLFAEKNPTDGVSYTPPKFTEHKFSFGELDLDHDDPGLHRQKLVRVLRSNTHSRSVKPLMR